MLFKVFTLRFSNRLEMFDDSPVNEFIKDKEILCLRDYFFVRDALPYLTVVVVYQLVGNHPAVTSSVAVGNSQLRKEVRQRDEGWREQLSEADMPLFNTLRSWRLERCKKEGIPPYVICNNRQLAEIVRLRPVTLAGLMRVDGFGKAKAKKYGDVLLKLLAEPMPVVYGSETIQESNDGAA